MHKLIVTVTITLAVELYRLTDVHTISNLIFDYHKPEYNMKISTHATVK